MSEGLLDIVIRAVLDRRRACWIIRGDQQNKDRINSTSGQALTRRDNKPYTRDRLRNSHFVHINSDSESLSIHRGSGKPVRKNQGMSG